MKSYNSYKKCAAIVLVLLFVFSPVFAEKAEAQWIVFDPSNFSNTLAAMVKDYGLDSIAWAVGNAVIQRMAAQSVNWINSGFKGSPGYVVNPEQFFGNIADGVAGQALYANPNFRFMCAPFRTQVQIALNQAYNQPYGQFQCTLSGAVNNFDSFMGDFSQGGWDGFISMTQNSQNNPIGLYTSWDNQLNQSVNSKIEQQKQELLQGNGIMSWKTCKTGYMTQEQADDQNGQIGINVYKPGDCAAGDEQTNTPGSVIQSQLDNVLNSGNGRLQVADEINEIISALLNQLTGRIVGGIGAGLRGSSGSDSGNNYQDYSQQLSNDAGTQTPIDPATSGISQDLINSKLSGIPIPSTPTGGLIPCPLSDGTVGVQNSDGSCGKNSEGGTSGAGGFVPIKASDGSTITGMPTDTDCSSTSFDDIVKRASDLYYAHEGVNKLAGITIAKIVQGMNCGPGGALPTSFP